MSTSYYLCNWCNYKAHQAPNIQFFLSNDELKRNALWNQCTLYHSKFCFETSANCSFMYCMDQSTGSIIYAVQFRTFLYWHIVRLATSSWVCYKGYDEATGVLLCSMLGTCKRYVLVGCYCGRNTDDESHKGKQLLSYALSIISRQWALDAKTFPYKFRIYIYILS